METSNNTEMGREIGTRSARKKKKRKIRLPRIIDKPLRRFSRLITKGQSDFLLVLFMTMLAIFGLIMIFSSSYYYAISEEGTPYYYLIQHSIWLVLGTILFIIGSMIDYHAYKKLAPWAAILGIVLLALLFTPLGTNINNATRWIKLGPITVMPGEIAKICAIMFTAWFLSEKPWRIDSLVHGVLPVVALAGIYGIMIFKQPNLSTAITVVGIVGCMLIVAGLHKVYIAFAFGLVGVGVVTLTTLLRHTYWYTRFASFLDPFDDPLGDSYQVVQSLLAIGSGGLTGVGLGKSIQKNLYLPEPQNDFILAIIGEELGFIGIILLMLLYCAFIWRGVRISLHARDRFGFLLSSGIVLMVTIQVILNVAVVTSSMPATGINLPFVGYGGNALLLFMFSTGILVNISRQNKRSEEKLEERLEA